MSDQTARRWVPDFLFDEVVPTPRAHPDAWLIAEAVTAPGWWVTDPADEESASERIDIGETMAFDWYVDHGEFVFTISPDGSFTTDHPIPVGATHFYGYGDSDEINVSPEEFAHEWAHDHFGAEAGKPTDVLVWVYQWSEKPVTFRLVLVDGKPHFEEVDDE